MTLSFLSAISAPEVALIVLGVLVLAGLVFAIVAKLIVSARYLSYKKVSEKGLSGEQTAELLIQKLGLENVQVKKLNWFIANLYGNHYNARKKTIYLRASAFNKQSITSVAVSTQKVAMAVMDKKGDKKVRVLSALQSFVFLAPALFVPISLIGVLLDVVMYKGVGVVTVIFVGIAFAFYFCAFLFTLLSIPVHRKANAVALELLNEHELLSEKERKNAKKLYSAYLLSYIADFILVLLNILKYIFKVIVKSQKLIKR